MSHKYNTNKKIQNQWEISVHQQNGERIKHKTSIIQFPKAHVQDKATCFKKSRLY